ncbi:MAG: AI-2E family transporter, partial [Campylobacter sp.]|nr:AI-2E family transporter [Campylobacter sp.]
AVNVAIGNVIEPRFLGQGLGLSTISVLAGLLLWGFVLGIGGLFLAVPLTMSIQIALASNDKTKSIATLLGNKVEK